MEDEESLLDGKLPSFSSDDSICLIHIQPEAPATLDPLDPSSSPKSSTDREKDIVKDSGFAHQSSEPTTHTEEEIERRSNPFSKWMDPSFDNGPVVAEKDKKTLDEGRKVTKEDQEDVNIAELESKHEEKREEEWVNRMSLEERKINQVIRELDSPKEEAEHAQKLSTPPKPSTLSKSSFQDGSGDNDENCVFSGEITQEEKVLAAQIRRMVEHGTPFTKHRRCKLDQVNEKGMGGGSVSQDNFSLALLTHSTFYPTPTCSHGSSEVFPRPSNPPHQYQGKGSPSGHETLSPRYHTRGSEGREEPGCSSLSLRS